MATTTATYQAFIFGGDICRRLARPFKKKLCCRGRPPPGSRKPCDVAFSASSRAKFPKIVNVFSPLHQITPVGATIRGPATTTNPVCGEGHLARRTSVSSAGPLHCSLRPELLIWGACPQSNGPNLAGNC